MKNKYILNFASFFGLMAIVLGAFGAHLIKEQLSSDSFDAYKTASLYLMIHAIFLLWLSQWKPTVEGKLKTVIAWLVIIGTILFSGSIFFLCTKSISGLNISWLGPITPIGGVFLISAWATLFFHSLTIKIK